MSDDQMLLRQLVAHSEQIQLMLANLVSQTTELKNLLHQAVDLREEKASEEKREA